MFSTEYNERGQTFLEHNDDIWHNASTFAACVFPKVSFLCHATDGFLVWLYICSI